MPGKRKSLKFIIPVLAILLLFGVFIISRHKSNPSNSTSDKPQPTSSNRTTAPQATLPGASVSQTQNSKSNTASRNVVPPAFTVYFPQNLPNNLSIDKSSIAFSKDSFSFAITQNNQSLFRIYEQPAPGNFSYKPLKSKLSTPADIDTALGKAIIGALGTSFILSVKTNKNTLIIINCTALACSTPSIQIIDSMRVNTNLAHIN